MTQLNAYRISWASLIPEKGGVTKRDLKAMMKAGVIIGNYFPDSHSKEITIHSPNRRELMNKLEKLEGRLHKEYQVFIYTDKQFSLRKEGQRIEEILTTKQIQESFKIR